MTNSYVDDLESVVEEVSTWGADLAEKVINALSPNGRAFGMDLLSDDEKLGTYMQMRGQPDLWQAWISNKTEEIIMLLINAGVSQEDVISINAQDIATSYAIKYSYEMEKTS